MSSRERFEAWWRGSPRSDENGLRHSVAWNAWQTRDAEVERLVDALREIELWIPYNRTELRKRIDALLREYDKPA